MKLFWQQAEKPSSNELNSGDKLANSKVADVANKVKTSNKKLKPFMIVIIVLAVGAGMVYLFRTYQKSANVSTETKINRELKLVAEYGKKNDIPNALIHAKRLLSYEPDNFEYKTLVASLLESQNPDEAKVFYAKLLDDIKKVDDPNENGKLISDYWTAAGLAEKAGQTERAKKYYQKVIDMADKNDGYEQSLAKQSQEALERLK